MTERIRAIQNYRPRIVQRGTVQEAELVRFIARSTGLNAGDIAQMLHELSDAVVFYNVSGRAVKLSRLGTYYPVIGLDGRLRAAHRLDPAIRKALNTPGLFTGQVINREHIGKTADELVALWNAEHPDDPVR